MLIALLVLICLILITTFLLLFKAYKSETKVLNEISSIKETLDIIISKNQSDTLLKLNELRLTIESLSASSLSNLSSLINSNKGDIISEIQTKTKESDINNYNVINESKNNVIKSIESNTSDIQKTIENKSNQTKSDVLNSFENYNSNTINRENQLRKELVESVDKILQEIKSPLSLD